jgi:hypothetical protein
MPLIATSLFTTVATCTLNDFKYLRYFTTVATKFFATSSC